MTMLELHATSRKQIQQFKTNLPQGVLLKGSDGVGLLSIARHIAGAHLVKIIQPTDKDGNNVTNGAGEIRVTQIRELAEQIRGKSRTRRVIIVDDADHMNTTSQNSFLKLLEEPTENVHFILTSHHAEKLLPTVVSRVQSVTIRNLSAEQSLAFITRLGQTDARKIQQLLFLASGRPAELTRLVNDNAYFTQSAKAVEDARRYLSGSLNERVATVQAYHNDRPGALLMLEQAIRILETTLRKQPSSATISSANQLTIVHNRLQHNGNVRLQLLDFVVQ